MSMLTARNPFVSLTTRFSPGFSLSNVALSTSFAPSPPRCNVCHPAPAPSIAAALPPDGRAAARRQASISTCSAGAAAYSLPERCRRVRVLLRSPGPDGRGHRWARRFNFASHKSFLMQTSQEIIASAGPTVQEGPGSLLRRLVQASEPRVRLRKLARWPASTRPEWRRPRSGR